MSYIQTAAAFDINGLTEDTTPDEAADFVPSYDASAAANKKVKPDNIQPKVTSATGTLPITNGGTGQTAQTAAFDALDPLTTQGQIIYHNGTNSVALGIGSTGNVLTVASGNPAWADPAGLTGSGFNFVILNSDVATSSSSLSDLTGATFAVTANKIYWFHCFIVFQTNATTEGSGFSITGPTSPNYATWWTKYTSAAASTVTDRTDSTYDTSFTGSGCPAGGGFCTIEGIISAASNTTSVQIRFRTENNSTGTTTVKAVVLYWKQLN